MAGFEIPYLLGEGGGALNDLGIIPLAGSASVTATLSIVHELSGTSAGSVDFGRNLRSTADKSHIVASKSFGTLGNTPASNTVDGDTATNIRFSQVTGQWLKWDMGTIGFWLDALEIDHSVGTGFSIGPFVIQGSHDDTNWETISDPTTTSGLAITTVDIYPASQEDFRYYRMSWTGGGGNDRFIAEVYFHGSDPRLTLTGAPHLMADQISGTSSVVATPFVGALDGDGDPIIELAGVIAGTSVVDNYEAIGVTFPSGFGQPVFLYINMNNGVGFNPTDDITAVTTGDYVAQSYPDGWVGEFLRALYSYMNIGVGFDDTDDASGRSDFTDQTYPDGDIRDDFARFFYLYLVIIKGVQGVGKLAILPSGVGRDSYVPRPDPPSNVNT